MCKDHLNAHFKQICFPLILKNTNKKLSGKKHLFSWLIKNSLMSTQYGITEAKYSHNVWIHCQWPIFFATIKSEGRILLYFPLLSESYSELADQRLPRWLLMILCSKAPHQTFCTRDNSQDVSEKSVCLTSTPEALVTIRLRIITCMPGKSFCTK